MRQIASLLVGMTWEELLAFFDDVLIFGATFAKHCESLDRALSLIEEAGLKVKPEKCCLLPQRVPFVGHILSAEGVSTDPEKVSPVESWPPPTNVSELRVFLGSFFRISQLSQALFSFLRKREETLCGPTTVKDLSTP